MRYASVLIKIERIWGRQIVVKSRSNQSHRRLRVNGMGRFCHLNLQFKTSYSSLIIFIENILKRVKTAPKSHPMNCEITIKLTNSSPEFFAKVISGVNSSQFPFVTEWNKNRLNDLVKGTLVIHDFFRTDAFESIFRSPNCRYENKLKISTWKLSFAIKPLENKHFPPPTPSISPLLIQHPIDALMF